MTAATMSASIMSVKSGVNTFVSTGAMFSMTRCFAPTSQAATSTAPAAPHGSTHSPTNCVTSTRIDANTADRERAECAADESRCSAK